MAYRLVDRPQIRVGQASFDWGDNKPRPLDLREVTRLNRDTGHQDMVDPYCAHGEADGRTLIAAALRPAANLEVVGHELWLTLAPQSSPHRGRAIADLCADLNKLGAVVPGTALRLVLNCATSEAPGASF